MKTTTNKEMTIAAEENNNHDGEQSRYDINPNDPLSTLPDELILAILKHVDDQTIKESVVFLSKKFNEITNEEFIYNFYGRSLRFIKWEGEQIDDFEKSINYFTNQHQVGFFNRPHQNRIQRSQYYVGQILFTIALAFGFCAISYLIYRFNYGDIYEQHNKPEPEKNSKEDDWYYNAVYFLAKLMLPLVSLTYLLSILDAHMANRAQNREHQESPITQEDIKNIKTLLTKYDCMLLNDIVSQLRAGVTTREQMLQLLKATLPEIKIHAEQLNTYLLGQRFKRKDINVGREAESIAPKEQNPNLHNYTAKMLGFWLKQDKKRERKIKMEKEKETKRQGVSKPKRA